MYARVPKGPYISSDYVSIGSISKIQFPLRIQLTGREVDPVCMRGSSVPSAVPPAPFRQLAKRGHIPNIWSPKNNFRERTERHRMRTYSFSYTRSDEETIVLEIKILTVCVCDKYFLYPAPLHHPRFWDLVLSSLATIEKPNISAESQRQWRMIPGRRWLCRCSSEKRNVENADSICCGPPSSTTDGFFNSYIHFRYSVVRMTAVRDYLASEVLYVNRDVQVFWETICVCRRCDQAVNPLEGGPHVTCLAASRAMTQDCMSTNHRHFD